MFWTRVQVPPPPPILPEGLNRKVKPFLFVMAAAKTETWCCLHRAASNPICCPCSASIRERRPVVIGRVQPLEYHWVVQLSASTGFDTFAVIVNAVAVLAVRLSHLQNLSVRLSPYDLYI